MLNIIFPQDTIFKMEQCTVSSQEIIFPSIITFWFIFASSLYCSVTQGRVILKRSMKRAKQSKKDLLCILKCFKCEQEVLPRVSGHSEPESAALPSGSLLQSVLAALSAKQLSAGDAVRNHH